MKTNRRDFLRGLVGASGAALLGSAAWPQLNALARQNLPGRAKELLPSPDCSGVEHVVVVMMENRSFDHFLGWLPNADGQQGGLVYTDGAGVEHDTFALAPDFTGCGHPDPDHSYAGGRTQYNDGAMDGFLRSGNSDPYSIGYYTEDNRPFYNALALNYTTLDRSFCSILGPTFPNRLFLHAAQTDRLSNTLTPATMPTIWDRIAAAGVTGRYYFSNVPFLGLWGAKYLPISHTYKQFLSDAALGTLPAVSFVDPRFTTIDDGTGNDDHPHADVRAGDAFLAETFQAVANGPAWSSTVFIVTYDEWGGFFDHVAPPRATAPNMVDTDLVDGKALLGFRVPTVLASPFTRGEPENPNIVSAVFDHTSILKLIEWRWGLLPLTLRDASDDIANLAEALNFDGPNTDVPELPRPDAPPRSPCLQPGLTSQPEQSRTTEWGELRRSGLLAGWPLDFE